MGNAWIVAWTARASLPRKWPLGRRSGMPKRHTSTGRLRWPLLAGNYANFTHQSKIDGILACTSLYPTNRNEQKWRGRCAESRLLPFALCVFVFQFERSEDLKHCIHL